MAFFPTRFVPVFFEPHARYTINRAGKRETSIFVFVFCDGTLPTAQEPVVVFSSRISRIIALRTCVRRYRSVSSRFFCRLKTLCEPKNNFYFWAGQNSTGITRMLKYTGVPVHWNLLFVAYVGFWIYVARISYTGHGYREKRYDEKWKKKWTRNKIQDNTIQPSMYNCKKKKT